MVDVVSSAQTYRREARRLRSVHANQPIRLHSALLELAKHSDRQMAVDSSAEPESDVRKFAASVAQALDGPVLRYSVRKRLIGEAESLGIRRFDANLLIAAVQHRIVKERSTPRVSVLPPTAKAWPAWAIPAGALLTLQTLILVAGYLVIHG